VGDYYPINNFINIPRPRMVYIQFVRTVGQNGGSTIGLHPEEKRFSNLLNKLIVEPITVDSQ
jgi:hypothetical protein